MTPLLSIPCHHCTLIMRDMAALPHWRPLSDCLALPAENEVRRGQPRRLAPRRGVVASHSRVLTLHRRRNSYHGSPSLHPHADVQQVPYEMYSPPTETRTWFHLGPVGPEHGEWRELDLTAEYWQKDLPALVRSPATAQLLEGLERRARRDAVRALRGSTLRSELYALDGAPRQARPYTVTESVSGLREESPPDAAEVGRRHIFFAHGESSRATQWERGDDPMTSLSLTGGYDMHGQPTMSTSVAVPRGRDYRVAALEADPYLATHQVTTYAKPSAPDAYPVDRVSSTTTYELVNAGTTSALDLAAAAASGEGTRVIGHTINYYDGEAFVGRPFGILGTHGAIVRTETLVMTTAMLVDGYRSGLGAANPPELPPYLVPGSPPPWTDDYPGEFRDLTPNIGGYTYYPEADDHHPGYHAQQSRRKYDFQSGDGRGLPVAQLDPLGRETTTEYDESALLPVKVTDPAGLTTRADYDYRLLRPILITDANGNRTGVAYSPSGLVLALATMGKATEAAGDTMDVPGVVFAYDLFAFVERREPVSVRSIKRVHHVQDTDVPEPERSETIVAVAYSDGFGRVFQTRSQAEDVVFGALPLGDAGLAAVQGAPKDVAPAVGTQFASGAPPRVVVTGWQIYDNKGHIVEKYEPVFSIGWDAAKPVDLETAKKVRLYYDPRGAVIRSLNPNGSEKRVVHGIPTSLSDPTGYAPTPWEAYAYDENDNAGRTPKANGNAPEAHWNTPASTRVDALGRVVEAIVRNGKNPDLQFGDWYVTRTTYDIRGNVVALTDPMGRVAARQVYDLANRTLRAESIDAGVRRMVYDAAGAALEARDSKGALSLHALDSAGRPARLWARDMATDAMTLRGRVIYGDAADSGLTGSDSAAKNLLGRAYREYDEAGLVMLDAYDFKGNLTDKARRIISDEAISTAYQGAAANGWVVQAFRVDWGGAVLQEREATLLETKAYRTTTSFDALGRVKHALYPEDVTHDRKVLVPRYNRAGAIESVTLGGSVFVARIAYNAKGQRLLVAYGNGLMTRYAYEEDTFRLARLRTEKFISKDGLSYAPTAPSDPLQDFAYGYDLAGNITSIQERVPHCGIPASIAGKDALDRAFEYDPIYRLLAANGREAAMAPPNADRDIWDPRPLPADPTLTRPYTEDYIYDRVGNLAEMKHSAQSGDFTREYIVSALSHRLEKTLIGKTAYDVTYDASGNLMTETTSRHFEWDYANRMSVFRTQVAGSEPSIHAHYLYGSGGERVKKLVRMQGGDFRVTTYIDGILEHDRGAGSTQEENYTLHVMDGVKRIATTRVGAPLDGDPTPPVKYQLGDHLGSSHVLVGNNGGLIQREEYRPYGETSFGSFGKKRYRFTGKERDEESGLYYVSARYYAPWMCRWTAADPIGTVDGTNLYVYVRGSPLCLTDPSGTGPPDENNLWEHPIELPGIGDRLDGTMLSPPVFRGLHVKPAWTPHSDPLSQAAQDRRAAARAVATLNALVAPFKAAAHGVAREASSAAESFGLTSPMSLSREGIEFLKTREGFEPEIKGDFTGKPTIGFGHLIRTDADKKRFTGAHLTEPQAEEQLRKDLAFHEATIRKNVKTDLTQNEFDALVIASFNGAVGPRTFAALNAGDKEKAMNEILTTTGTKDDKGTVVHDPNLATRRVLETRMFVEGEYRDQPTAEDRKIAADVVAEQNRGKTPDAYHKVYPK